MGSTMRKLGLALSSALCLATLARPALAVETATPCPDDEATCEGAPIAFSKEIALPIMGGFDTGWVPQSSPLQVDLFAQLFASTKIDLAGQLLTKWPDALTLETPGTPGAGSLGIHYGLDVGANAHVHVTVLGQTFDWTGPIPYTPKVDFQVDAQNAFDPWAFAGTSVDGTTMPQKLASVSAKSFIGVNIPGLDGGFELDTQVELAATYKTDDIVITHVDGVEVEGGPILAEDGKTLSKYLGGPSVELDVHPEGEVAYDGKIHLIPAFYISTIGPSFNIPIADIPIPFHFEQKPWVFDPVRVHVPLPDIQLERDPTGGAPPSADGEVVELGAVPLGGQSAKKIVVTNVGEARLFATFASSDGTHFALSSATGTLDPSHTYEELVVFTALEAGDFTTTLTIASNDPDEPTRTITLHATATSDAATPIVAAAGPLAEDGCGCRVPRTRGDGASGLVALGLLGLALVRRRGASSPRA